jgi:hypothetical protein
MKNVLILLNKHIKLSDLRVKKKIAIFFSKKILSLEIELFMSVYLELHILFDCLSASGIRASSWYSPNAFMT